MTTARSTLKQTNNWLSQAKNILTRAAVNIGTAVAKASCIEHTGWAGNPPEEDSQAKKTLTILTDLLFFQFTLQPPSLATD